MKIIPSDVNDRNSILKDDYFYLVKDPKHKLESFHYTAWCKDANIKSLIDIQRKHIPMIRNIIKRFGYHFSIAACNYKVIIHFPPNFWRLHIHFVAKNHKIPETTPNDAVFDAYDVIRNITEDEDFYLNRVKICKL